MIAVPDRIALPHVGVVLSRYHESDIDGLYAAIEENRDHLRPHMPWADEGRHEFVAFVTDAIAQWDRGADRKRTEFPKRHDETGSWWRSYGNENWAFDAHGYMTRREASINDIAITAAGRRLFGSRPSAEHDHTLPLQ
jgi:Protein of unknown function (DUF1348)